MDTFGFKPGRILARKYEVVSLIGAGWEGEVYKLRELGTDIIRAGKFFFPKRNPKNKTLKFHAQKLHKLRSCDILIKYNTLDEITFKREKVSFMVSEFVEGETLSSFLERQSGKRLPAFEALHLLYALAKGIECLHNLKEYHGDLHTDNILITRFGLGFELKVLDLFHWGNVTTENILTDIYDITRVFYDVLGGPKFYNRQPDEVKGIVCGLKKTLIKRKFKNAGQLRQYLESMHFDSLLR